MGFLQAVFRIEVCGREWAGSRFAARFLGVFTRSYWYVGFCGQLKKHTVWSSMGNRQSEIKIDWSSL